MTKLIQITAEYDGAADAVFAQAMRLSDLRASTRTADAPESEGEIAEGQTYQTDIALRSGLTIRGHQIKVERLDPVRRQMQLHEDNSQVRRWDRLISVQPLRVGAVWVDRVILDAGWRTGLVARLVAQVYAQQHARRAAQSIRSKITDLPA